jgi:hypothetical protein
MNNTSCNVRHRIVNSSPATAKGTAIAIAEPTPALPLPPRTRIIAEATAAKAASGATAAPILAQPKAIICSEPPRIRQGNN